MNRIFTVLVLLSCLSEPGITQPGWTPVKKAIASNIDEQSPDLISMSDAIWGFAETAFLESQSADVLAAYAEEQGFRVQRGVAELPTSIVAEFGSGHPIIGILGEYDALPGLSQKSQVEKEPLVEGAPGHGCGHNLFGVASLGAATAIKDMIASGQLQGTVRSTRTPPCFNWGSSSSTVCAISVRISGCPGWTRSAGVASGRPSMRMWSLSKQTRSYRGSTACRFRASR